MNDKLLRFLGWLVLIWFLYAVIKTLCDYGRDLTRMQFEAEHQEREDETKRLAVENRHLESYPPARTEGKWVKLGSMIAGGAKILLEFFK